MLLSAPVSPAFALSACCSHTTYQGPASQQSVLSQGTWLKSLSINRPQLSEGPSLLTMSPNSRDLSELRAELVEFCSQMIWGLIPLLISRVKRFSEGRGWLGVTFLVLTPGPVPLPSVPVLVNDPHYDAYYDETGKNSKDDLGYVIAGWGRRLHCMGDCGR